MPIWVWPRRFTRKVAALDRSTDIGPKALRAHKVAPVVGALLAIGVAVLLYRSQRDAGFAILAVLSGASGWLLSGRVARLICLGEVIGERIKITVVADEPPEKEIASGFEYPIARNQAARAAIRTGRPALVRPDHLAGPLRDLADRLGWPVLIMAPVYCGGSLHGLLAASARDGPAVDQLQQNLLGSLARLTSSSLNSAADKHDLLSAAARNRAGEITSLGLLPGIVDELREAVKPIKQLILEL